MISRRKLDETPDWESFAWTRIGDMDGKKMPMDFLVKGGVPRLLKSGPRKGEKTWRDAKTRECLVTEVEINAEMARYETETGNCSDCGGSGKEWAGWSADGGTKYRACNKCDGSGRAA
jgi:hypothetical protein